MAKLPAHFLHLVQDALLKSFHFKKDLRAFLRRCGVSDSAIGQMHDSDLKRDWLTWLFPKLEKSDRGQALLQSIANQLAEQESFPGLERIEDSAERIEQAKQSVKALRDFINRKNEEAESEKQKTEIRKRSAEEREKALQARANLSTLKSRLDNLFPQIGKQQGGYDFQDWFYDLVDYFEVDCRRPYNVDGRQIDGSVTLDGTTYLVELKFTDNQASATDVDSLLAKVNSKADNTMGIMVSISGYSGTAIETASYAKTPLLLFDYQHIYNLVLAEVESLPNVVRRVRRHSSQTGRAFLAVTEFGN